MSAITLGVIGTGTTSRKAVKTFLDDWATANQPIVSVVVPGDEPEFTVACAHVADWALATGQHLTFVVRDEPKGLEDYIGADKVAVMNHKDPQWSVIHTSTDLLLAWDDEDDGTSEKTAKEALKVGAKVYDLTDALFPITDDGTDEPEVEVEPTPVVEDPAPEPKPAPKKRQPRTKPKPVEEPAPEPAPDEAQAMITVLSPTEVSPTLQERVTVLEGRFDGLMKALDTVASAMALASLK